MPTSQQYQISKIMDFIVCLNPHSVLDIGVGFGKYGLLCREYLELWDGREEINKFTRKIDGIEVYPEYINDVHRYVYDQIYIGNALNIIPKVETNYDLTMMIDVLEHFEKQEGAQLIEKILSVSKYLLISVPKDIGHQGEMFGNQYEAHIGDWSVKELLEFAPSFRLSDHQSHIVVIGKQAEVSRLKRIFDPPVLIKIKRWLSSGLEVLG